MLVVTVHREPGDASNISYFDPTQRHGDMNMTFNNRPRLRGNSGLINTDVIRESRNWETRAVAGGRKMEND